MSQWTIYCLSLDEISPMVQLLLAFRLMVKPELSQSLRYHNLREKSYVQWAIGQCYEKSNKYDIHDIGSGDSGD